MTLSLDDLDIVLKDVFKCRAKWYNIGLGLKVSVGTLDAIEKKFNNDPGDCLREALKEWLKTSESEHTWNTLATVLRSGPVGEGVVGSELENRCFAEQSVYRNGSRRATSKRWKCNIGISLSILIAILAIAIVVSLQWYNGNLPDDDDVDLSKTSSDQTEIDKPSLYGSCRSEGVAPNDLPYLPGRFIGRDNEMKNITELLIHPSISHINAIGIYGPPAVGKSTLAIHVGYQMVMCGVEVRYINIYDSYHLFKQPDVADSGKPSQAKSQPSQKDSSEMLQPGGKGHIHLLVYSDTDQKYIQWSPHGLLEWAKRIKKETLLILDNCDDLLEDKLFMEIVRALTEASAALRVIITSRQKVTVIGGFKAYHLRELDNSSAIELLQLESDYQINYTNSKTIAELVGNNPLALRIAAKLVDDRHSDGMLIANLRRNLLKTLTHTPYILPETQNISYLLQLSYDHLKYETQVCGYYLSLFPGSFDQDAAINILYNCCIKQPNTCLNDLEASSLLEPYLSAGQPRFQYHRLIREYFKHKSHEREGLHSHERAEMFNISFQIYFADVLYNMTINTMYNRRRPSDEMVGRLERDIHNYVMLLEMYTSRCIFFPSYFKFATSIFMSDESFLFLPKAQLLQALSSHVYFNNVTCEGFRVARFAIFNLAVVWRLRDIARTSSNRTLVQHFICEEAIRLLTAANDSCLLSRHFYEYVLVMVYYKWTCWWEYSGVHVSIILSSLLSSGILIVLGTRFGMKSTLSALLPVSAYKLMVYIISKRVVVAELIWPHSGIPLTIVLIVMLFNFYRLYLSLVVTPLLSVMLIVPQTSQYYKFAQLMLIFLVEFFEVLNFLLTPVILVLFFFCPHRVYFLEVMLPLNLLFLWSFHDH